TVSPIRHMGDGAHANTVSKATLHLAVQQLLGSFEDTAITPCTPSRGMAGYSLSRTGNLEAKTAIRTSYFPAYEILLDELRDYRFYAEDLVHPSPTTVEIIWERFLDACVPAAEHARIRENEKAARAALHRSLF
ncbi:MAG: GSCFA domain-containing protein, partial [Bacteroidales bacterium]|nr:GSCFA domain-containing protein [Bacteroidales bacterium]